MNANTIKYEPILSRISNNLKYLQTDMWNEVGDPRVANLNLFTGGPWTVVSIIVCYLYFVLHLGPNYMKNRKAFDLKNLVFYYNIAMIVSNGYMFVHGMMITSFGLDAWGCQLPNYQNPSYNERAQVFVGYCFFLSKIIELFDTIIFILRKKSNQVTLLHVIHHSLVPILIWIGFKISPGGNMALFPLINSLIHTIMYTYYALSTFGPSMAPYLWWKMYLTRIQMVQFIIVMTHSLHVLFIPSCDFPKSLLYMSISNAFLFLILFYSFYKSTYHRSSKKQKMNGNANQLNGDANSLDAEILLNGNGLKKRKHRFAKDESDDSGTDSMTVIESSVYERNAKNDILNGRSKIFLNDLLDLEVNGSVPKGDANDDNKDAKRSVDNNNYNGKNKKNE